MTSIDDIVSLGDLLRKLRDADRKFRVFGSERHRYRLGQKLTESELAAFELTNGIWLPTDYRRFLSMVGNGGAGPFYGLEPLGTFGRDLSRPFSLVEATDKLSDEQLNQLPDRDDYPGVLEFCHQGCAHTSSSTDLRTAPCGTAAETSTRLESPSANGTEGGWSER